MRRRFRRRESPPERFVSLDEEFDADLGDEASVAPDIPPMLYEAEADSRPQTRLVPRYRALLLVLLLIAAGVLIAGGAVGQIPPDLVERWPWLLVVLGALGLLVGLVTAWPGATLGGPLLLGLGLVALLDQSAIASTTMALAGAALIALGVAVILRGLTMPRARR